MASQFCFSSASWRCYMPLVSRTCWELRQDRTGDGDVGRRMGTQQCVCSSFEARQSAILWRKRPAYAIHVRRERIFQSFLHLSYKVCMHVVQTGKNIGVTSWPGSMSHDDTILQLSSRSNSTQGGIFFTASPRPQHLLQLCLGVFGS